MNHVIFPRMFVTKSHLVESLSGARTQKLAEDLAGLVRGVTSPDVVVRTFEAKGLGNPVWKLMVEGVLEVTVTTDTVDGFPAGCLVVEAAESRFDEGGESLDLTVISHVIGALAASRRAEVVAQADRALDSLRDVLEQASKGLDRVREGLGSGDTNEALRGLLEAARWLAKYEVLWEGADDRSNLRAAARLALRIKEFEALSVLFRQYQNAFMVKITS